ncbi:GH103 : Membrane-bound lytic murein transglycosylase B [Magnetospira sp. QH-2]|nr:GH103 : Membrane-bound lytic murein transglycosylase B [Magnetospira sp. QH-2]
MKLAGSLVLATLLGGVSHPAAAQAPFEDWLGGLRQEAQRKGVSKGILDRALKNLQPVPRVLELDRSQPEFTQTLWSYLNKRINDTVINRGREMLAKHGPLLDRVEAQYGVQKRFLVAFWGLESYFGKYTGTFPLVGALATLAHDERRSEFFRAQLLAALQSMQDGDIPVEAKSSWAGAMGHCQFIPTTFRGYAVDFNGDGKRDMWSSLEDVFGSAANYLSKSGWNHDRTWGREVSLPDGFNLDQAGLKIKKNLAEWQALGVRRFDGRDLPKVDIEGSVILPAGIEGPAFMVYQNFRTIMVWNRSQLYAVAVGHLADRLVGKGPFLTPQPKNTKAMARKDIKAMQDTLNELGLDAGKPDGIAGPQTREAVKAYQRHHHLPADGYPSHGLLERMGIL